LIDIFALIHRIFVKNTARISIKNKKWTHESFQVIIKS